jgi:hypothetical protein
MSRLTSRLQEIEAHQRRVGNAKAVEHHLGEAGDALELAARVALGSFKARDRNPDESDVFRLGYLTACKELAVVLRCMRAGTTPEPGDLPRARLEAAEELGQARPSGGLPTAAAPVASARDEDLHEMLLTLRERNAVREARNVYDNEFRGVDNVAVLDGLIARFPSWDRDEGDS